ncbi:MAG: tetratricopeptide repeat protein [Pirellulales bacterium]|nr:tetratricopeptide repeat protein [Pirellulales bacterium]
MSQGLEVDVRQAILSNAPFGPQTIVQMTEAIAHNFGNYRNLRDAVQELEAQQEQTPASKVRLGVGLFLLGRYRRAAEVLSEADGGPLAHFYKAKALAAAGQHDEAGKAYEQAAKAGYDANLCALGRAEALRSKGDVSAALALLDGLSGPVEQSAEYLYQRGASVAALGGNPSEVVALYERAVQAEPNHAGALFGLAMENDRRGNDDVAFELYERSTNRFPPHLGSLINLGLLYEDHNHLDRAYSCFQRVLDVFPDHPRARLYLKDVDAAGGGPIDDDVMRRIDRQSQMLSVPVTDFELSVRSRNCLQKMGINTLGDLARATEAELLASKNFGETSLVEIKDMMASKGLRLGLLATDKRPEVVEPESMTPDEQALLTRPISDLNLSVRARKCMIRLGISTVGELVRHTGDELLECKNFGVTSLTEVREKLTAHALKLRGD